MDNLIDTTKMDELISNHLIQGLTRSESQKLSEWIDASEDNKNYFLKQQEIWFSAVSAKNGKQFDSEQAFRRFLNRTAHQPISAPKVGRFSLYRCLRVAAVVAIAVGLFGSSFWLGERHFNAQLADITVEAPLGSRSKLYLPDGTQVWLNAGSKLTYSQGFGVNDRKISLEGEGYFEVTKNKKLPFAVKTTEMVVTVLGTKFNFRNYAADEEASVTLLEGRVELKNNLVNNNELFLNPNQRAVLNKKSGKASISNVQAYRASQWTRGLLCFNEEKLTDIARVLERSYNVKINIEDDTLNNFRFYGNFTRNDQTIKEVMDVLASTNKLSYQIQGKKILLFAK